MGTLAASAIIRRAQRRLLADRVLWLDTELLEYLSDGQRRAVELRPEIHPDTRNVALVSGTRQDLPADAFVLIDVIRNIRRGDGSAGQGIAVSSDPAANIAITGNSIKPISDKPLQRVAPDWHTRSAGETAEVIYDRRNRRTYWVSPPSPGRGTLADDDPASGHQIEIVVAKIPAEITDGTVLIELDDLYGPILLYYVLSEAFSKGIGLIGQEAREKSDHYYTRFEEALLGRASTDVRLTLPSTLEEKGTPRR